MKRLTKRDRGGNAVVDCNICEMGESRLGNCGVLKCRNRLKDRLAAYEDAEDQGRLIVLPCKVGKEVFSVEDAAIYCAVDGAEEVDHILQFEFGDCGLTFSTEWYEPRPIEEIGKTVFFRVKKRKRHWRG